MGLTVAKPTRADESAVDYELIPEIDVKVLDSSTVNAFTLPGGHFYLFTGLMDAMPDDAELAGVIGHEIGHVNKAHFRSMVRNSAVLEGVQLHRLQGDSDERAVDLTYYDSSGAYLLESADIEPAGLELHVDGLYLQPYKGKPLSQGIRFDAPTAVAATQAAWR